MEGTYFKRRKRGYVYKSQLQTRRKTMISFHLDLIFYLAPFDLDFFNLVSLPFLRRHDPASPNPSALSRRVAERSLCLDINISLHNLLSELLTHRAGTISVSHQRRYLVPVGGLPWLAVACEENEEKSRFVFGTPPVHVAHDYCRDSV